MHHRNGIRVLGVFSVIVLFLAGVSFAKDAHPGTTARPSFRPSERGLSAVRAAGLPVVETVQEHYSLYDISGFKLSSGGMAVLIKNNEGRIVFQSFFPVMANDGKHLFWQYDDNPQQMSKSTQVGADKVVTLREMAIAAKDIIKQIKRGRVVDPRDPASTAAVAAAIAASSTTVSASSRMPVKRFDNWGCDYPFDSLSCTSVGNCCDAHDSCYAAFGCDAWSWAGLSVAECVLCDAAAVTCISGSGGTSNGQASVCCSMNNCNQPRSYVDYSPPAGGGGPDNQYVAPDNEPPGTGVWNNDGTPYGMISIQYTSNWCAYYDDDNCVWVVFLCNP
jgi:hypothetical protein